MWVSTTTNTHTPLLTLHYGHALCIHLSFNASQRRRALLQNITTRRCVCICAEGMQKQLLGRIYGGQKSSSLSIRSFRTYLSYKRTCVWSKGFAFTRSTREQMKQMIQSQTSNAHTHVSRTFVICIHKSESPKTDCLYAFRFSKYSSGKHAHFQFELGKNRKAQTHFFPNGIYTHTYVH